MRIAVVRKKYLYLLAAAIFMATIVSVLRYSGFLKLRTVTISDEAFSCDLDLMNQALGQNIFSVPVDATMDKLMGNKEVVRVDVAYALPDGIEIDINKIYPEALVLANDGRTLYQLAGSGRLLPYDGTVSDFNVPLITGVGNCRPYDLAGNGRIGLIMEQMARLKDDCMDFYLATSNIDLSGGHRISIFIDGLSFEIETYAGTLYDSMIRLKLFLMNFSPDLQGIKKLNMRNEELIITTGR